ncbi:MAG: glycosyltransferase family 39 protein [Acidimicrobiales bacterium]
MANIAKNGPNGVDLGYWAEDADPDGVHHPILWTSFREDHGWVSGYSSAVPLANSAGHRAFGGVGALWLPILAMPLGALGAARVSRQLGAQTGLVDFVVGALSPLTFYGADQWEHAPALAAALWALAFLREELSLRQFFALGLTAGVAVSLRRKVGLLLGVMAMVELWDGDRRRWWLGRIPHSAAAGASALAVFVGVNCLDAALIGSTLAQRSAYQAERAGANFGARIHDGILTSVSQYSNLDPTFFVFGSMALVGVALASWGWERDDETRVKAGIVFVGISLVVRAMVGGLLFLPGAFAAIPLIAAAPIFARRSGRLVIVGALVSVAMIIMLQWTGTFAAQWGGRYLLFPAAVVAVISCTELERRDLRHPAAVLAIASTALVAGLGLAWHIERPNGFSESRDQILALKSGDVVIATQPRFGRELAVDILDERWLSAWTPERVAAAFDGTGAAAPDEAVWLLHPGTCVTDGCGRRCAEHDDAGDLGDSRSTSLHKVFWLVGDTYVLEKFAPG